MHFGSSFARLAGILVLGGYGVACFAEPPSAPPASPGSPDRSEKPASIVDGNYHLAHGDVVKVTVFQQDDLTTTTRIGDDGTIQFPLIGGVELGGKTVRQGASIIESLLKKGYLRNPQVVISITEFVKKRFTILGQVKNPGSFEIAANENLDVIQVIGMAGGFTRSANQGNIMIKRTVDGEERIFKVNGKEMAHGEKTKNFRIISGDTITVGESLF